MLPQSQSVLDKKTDDNYKRDVQEQAKEPFDLLISCMEAWHYLQF